MFAGNSFSSTDSVECGARWLKIANVSAGQIKWNEESFLPISYLDKYSEYRLNPGDYVMALTRPILNKELKIARIIDGNALLNQRVAKLLFNCNSKFGYQLLRKHSTVEMLENELAGTDPPNLSGNTLDNIAIMIPSEKEQEMIGSFFDNIDNIIAIHTNKCELVKEYKKGLLQQMFV